MLPLRGPEGERPSYRAAPKNLGEKAWRRLYGPPAPGPQAERVFAALVELARYRPNELRQLLFSVLKGRG